MTKLNELETMFPNVSKFSSGRSKVMISLVHFATELKKILLQNTCMSSFLFYMQCHVFPNENI